MRRLYSIFSLLIISLFILSFTKYTYYSAGLIGFTDVNNPYKDTYLEYISMDTNIPIIMTVGGSGSGDYLIAMDDAQTKTAIKKASNYIPYKPFDEETHEFYGCGNTYAVYNMKYLLSSATKLRYKVMLGKWFAANPPQMPDCEEIYAEPVVIISDQTYLGEDTCDSNYQFDYTITTPFYMCLDDDDGDGPRLIMEAENIPFYDSDSIIAGNPRQLTTISRFKNTVVLNQ